VEAGEGLVTAPSLYDGPVQVTPLDVTLRPYQQQAVDGIYNWFGRETGNPLVVLPTGAGKSLVNAAFIHSVLSQWPTERIVCLTHVKELIAQNHAALLRAWPGAPAGIYSAGLKRREADAPILFAGIQSVYRKAEQVGWADLVIIDEAHLVPAKSMGMYREFLDALRSMNSNLKVIGLTATPFRTDSGSLDKGDDRLFHGVAYDCDLVGLIEDGYLSPIVSKGTKAEIDVTGVHTVAGDYKKNELEKAARAEGKVAAAVQEIVKRGADRKAWLLFCSGKKHAREVADEMREHGIECELIFGDTPSDERDDIIARYKAGELRAIANYGVLTTGFDAPHVDLIALLRPTQSPGLFVQMCGRGLRIAPGKENCLVLDFGGNVIRHGPLDRVKVREPKKGDGTVRARECPSCESLVAVQVRVCPDCGFEWAVAEAENVARHEETPDEESRLLAGMHPAGGIERWKVSRVRYTHHHKKGKPHPVLRVEYDCGFNQRVSEWICFEHEGFPRKKAVRWWRERAGAESEAPDTVDLAQVRIEAGAFIREPRGVTVDVRPEYPELKAVRFERLPGEDDEPLPPPRSKRSIRAVLRLDESADISIDDIPF